MLSINFSELFWGIFNFFLLLFLLNRFLYKPLIKFMDDRKARIDAGLDEEKKALAEEQANNDGIEAALDEANVTRYAEYMRRMSDKTQFLVITHRRGTMEEANMLYGVTMQERGVSKLLMLNIEDVEKEMDMEIK